MEVLVEDVATTEAGYYGEVWRNETSTHEQGDILMARFLQNGHLCVYVCVCVCVCVMCVCVCVCMCNVCVCV